MEQVLVSKTKLLEIVSTNREIHHKAYTEAYAGYRKMAIEKLQEALSEAKSGGKATIHVKMPAPEPEDHTEDYDRVIGMLRMCVKDEVEVSTYDYDQYVLDKWEWKQRFSISSSSYSSSSSSSS